MMGRCPKDIAADGRKKYKRERCSLRERVQASKEREGAEEGTRKRKRERED